MDNLFDGLTIVDFHGDTFRNILTIRKSENVYDDLGESQEDWDTAIHHEQACKPAQFTSDQPIINRPFEEAQYNDAIRYPFDHWASSRYSDGSYGVWYGTDTLETSIHETVYHWRNRFLVDAGWENIEGIVSERKVYLVRCEAALMDFRPRIGDFPDLVNPTSYHFTHQVGARIHHDGHPGIISRSARTVGDIFTIFSPQVLSNPRNHCFLSYTIENGHVVVEREAGRELLRL